MSDSKIIFVDVDETICHYGKKELELLTILKLFHINIELIKLIN